MFHLNHRDVLKMIGICILLIIVFNSVGVQTPDSTNEAAAALGVNLYQAKKAEALTSRKSFAESIGMTFVTVLKGDFMMGTSASQARQRLERFADAKFFPSDNEQPWHRVRITKIDGLSRDEVTVGQFRRFVDETGYNAEAKENEIDVFGFNAAKQDMDQDAKYTWRNPGFPQNDANPVVLVSWNDCTEFCRWISRKDGRTYRLPTEAEWEYCCRAGTRSLYSFGDDPELLARFENVADAKLKARVPQFALKYHKGTIKEGDGDDGFAFTAPVGSYKPNAWGLHDMHGNVCEWCLDKYDADYYTQSPGIDPSGPTGFSVYRVSRGGSWSNAARDCRSSDRDGMRATARHCSQGFRVARVALDP